MRGLVRREAKHEQVEALLSVYLDGRASAAERALVEQHLQSCEDCARSLATLRATVTVVQAMPRVRAPRSFALPRSMIQQPRPTSGLYLPLRAATAVATSLLIIAAAGDLLTSATQLPVAAPAYFSTSVAMEPGATSAPLSVPQPALSAMVSPTVGAKPSEALAATAPAAVAPTALAKQEGFLAATVAPAVPAPAVEQPTATSASPEPGVRQSLGGATPVAAAKAAPPAPVAGPATQLPLTDSGPGGRATGGGQPAYVPPTMPPLLAQPSPEAETTTSAPMPSTEIIRSPVQPPPFPPASPAPTQVARVLAPQPPPAGEHRVGYSATQRQAVNPFRVVEGALAAMAIAFGVAAWVVRRRSP